MSSHTSRGHRTGCVVESSSAPVLELDGVRAAYGPIEVLHGVDLTVGAGQVVALLGPNGGGKSTTLKVAAGPAPGDGRRRALRRPVGARRDRAGGGRASGCA